ncbi:MAG: transporter substrate-binding domain-containing protein [Rubrivivax sp.]|nr:transporter substrate-binding domain-containing protein [Rubrivivax sp.]
MAISLQDVRRLAGVALLLACALPGAGAAEAPLFDRLPVAVKGTKVLRMVGDSFAPYRIVAEDGKTVTGLETDLVRALEPILGVKIEQSIVSNLPAMLAGIDTGRYDLSSGPLLSTKAREERYDIVTWLLSKPAWVLPASGRKTTRLEELCGLRISFAAGSTQEEYLRKVTERCTAAGLPATVPVALTDQNATVLAVQSGRADAASMQFAAALHLLRQSPNKFHIQTDPTDALGVLQLGFVTKKGSELTPVLHEALKRLWTSGDYAKILAKWGLSAAAAPEPRLNPSSR